MCVSKLKNTNLKGVYIKTVEKNPDSQKMKIQYKKGHFCNNMNVIEGKKVDRSEK